MGIETSVLYMTFKNQVGKVCTLTVDDPREDLQASEVKTFMEQVLSENIFLPKGYPLTTIVSAKVVNKDTVEYDLEV